MDEAIRANESATNQAAIEDYENEKEATGGDSPVKSGGVRSINGNAMKKSGGGSKRRCTSERGSDADGSDTDESDNMNT